MVLSGLLVAMVQGGGHPNARPPVRDIDFTSHPLSRHPTPHAHGWYFDNGNWARTGAFPL